VTARHAVFGSFLEYDVEITSTEWMEFASSKNTGRMIFSHLTAFSGHANETV
jgi:hypothetical protein